MFMNQCAFEHSVRNDAAEIRGRRTIAVWLKTQTGALRAALSVEVASNPARGRERGCPATDVNICV